MRHPVYDKKIVEVMSQGVSFRKLDGPPKLPVDVQVSLEAVLAFVGTLSEGEMFRTMPHADELAAAHELVCMYFSKPADDCNPHGMERLFPDDGGVA